MFLISLPDTAEIGQTYDVKINGQREGLTWRDPDTLVIEPGGIRRIIHVHATGTGLMNFRCAEAEGWADVTIFDDAGRAFNAARTVRTSREHG